MSPNQPQNSKAPRCAPPPCHDAGLAPCAAAAAPGANAKRWRWWRRCRWRPWHGWAVSNINPWATNNQIVNDIWNIHPNWYIMIWKYLEWSIPYWSIIYSQPILVWEYHWRFGGFLKWRIPKMDQNSCFKWNILLKWMIWCVKSLVPRSGRYPKSYLVTGWLFPQSYGSRFWPIPSDFFSES